MSPRWAGTRQPRPRSRGPPARCGDCWRVPRSGRPRGPPVFVGPFWGGGGGPPFRSLDGTAAVLNAAAPLGILAVAVALLMIGGEFDLSVGSIIGVAGMTIMLLTRHFDWALWPAIGLTILLCLAIGLGNGYLV